MSNRLVTIHGITQVGIDYADALALRVCGPDLPAVVLQWAGPSGLLDYVAHYRNIFMRPDASWWHPLRRLHQQWITAAHESAQWVKSYDRSEIHDRALAYVEGHILREMSEGADGFYFVAHSLGCIVLLETLDAMLTAAKLMPAQVRGIVTMGNPLSFWRDPDTIIKLARPIAEAAPWFNLYDVDDAIANMLAPLCGRIKDVEVSTGGLLTAHGGYWNSRQVGKIVKALVAGIPAQK